MSDRPADGNKLRAVHRPTSGLRRSWVALTKALSHLPGKQTLLAICCAAVVGYIQLSIRMTPVRAPPPSTFFAGLPVSGSLADARQAGFNDCFESDAVHLRCRRRVWVVGYGPYEAAVDLEGSEGEGGFDQLVIWHDKDNHAVFRIAEALKRAGWGYCFTGDGRWGDQAIYSHVGSPTRVSMDISFWSKRRLRILPASDRTERRCSPNQVLRPRRHTENYEAVGHDTLARWESQADELRSTRRRLASGPFGAAQ